MKNKNWEQPIIFHGVPTRWNWIVNYPEGLELGENVDIGAFTFINAKYGVRIGNNVKIGGGCMIYSHNTIDDTKGGIIIYDEARIGANSVILPMSVIHSNVTIGALSLVKGYYLNGVFGGVPAKRLIGGIVNEKIINTW